MRNVGLLVLLVLVMAAAGRIVAAPEKPIVYRLRIEEGVAVPGGASAADKAAIAELNALLRRWPQLLWLAAHDGKLFCAKIGDDGRPVK